MNGPGDSRGVVIAVTVKSTVGDLRFCVCEILKKKCLVVVSLYL